MATDISTIVYIGTTAPTLRDGVVVGQYWRDTTGTVETLKKCTAVSPSITWDTVATPGDMFKSLFDADTFLYATNDDTPLATSPANVLAALTGHAGAAFDWNNQNLNNIKQVNLTDPTELTIVAGVITKTQGFHTVDTEADASSDDLDTINGGVIGDLLTIAPANAARQIIVKRTGNIRFKFKPISDAFSFASPAGSSGIFYGGGFYYAPAADANLTQAAAAVSWGSANSAYGAKAFIVSKEAGVVAAGAGNVVSIVVSGTSIEPTTGVRSAGSTETIVANITAMGANTFYQTAKRWVGAITFTLTVTGGAPATYSADFNYGFNNTASFAERHAHITRFNVKARAGASDTAFNIRLLLHNGVGWTYSAAAFKPGAAVGSASEICNMNTDYVTEKNLVLGEAFGYLRTDMMVHFDGTAGEGFIMEITTGANKAIDTMTMHVFGHVVTNQIPMDTLGSALLLQYNGTDWMEL